MWIISQSTCSNYCYLAPLTNTTSSSELKGANEFAQEKLARGKLKRTLESDVDKDAIAALVKMLDAILELDNVRTLLILHRF